MPLMVLMLLLAVSALTGRSLVPTAHAGTNIDITGTVADDVYVDTSGCGAAALAIGDLVPGTDGWKTAQDTSGQLCTLSFGSNTDPLGADLTIFEDPAAPASPTAAMKCVNPSCAGDAINDYDNSSEPSAGTSAFGLQLVATGGPAVGAWSSAPAVYDVQDAGDIACSTTTTGAGTCSFTPGATASVADASGSYQAAAALLALAR